MVVQKFPADLPPGPQREFLNQTTLESIRCSVLRIRNSLTAEQRGQANSGSGTPANSRDVRMTTNTASDQREEAAAKRRRVATQRVRDARDRLTSSTGTRPAFDYEMMRLFAQNRLSASLVVLLAGRDRGLPVEPVDRCRHRRHLDRRRAADPCRHRHQMPAVPGAAAVRGEPEGLAAALHPARPVLRPRLDVQPGAADRRERRHRHLHAVRDAARGRGLEHARLLAADRGVRLNRAGDRRGRDQLRDARAICTTTSSPSWR